MRGAQEHPAEGRTNGEGGIPVQRILEVRVVLEGRVTEKHRALGTAANWEGVSNDCPLGRDRQRWVGLTGLPTKWVSRAQSRGCPGPRPAHPLHPSPHLRLPCQSQDLPQVVQEPDEVEPVWGRERGRAG